MCKTLSRSAAKILHPWPHLCAPQTWLDLGRFACPQRADGNSQQGKQRCSQRCFFFFFPFRRAEIGVVKRRWLSYRLLGSTVREISVDHSRTLRLWYDVWALKSSLEEIWEEKWGVMQVLAQPKPWLWLITWLVRDCRVTLAGSYKCLIAAVVVIIIMMMMMNLWSVLACFFSDYVAALVNKSNKSINSAQLAILTCSTKGNGLREFLATGNWFRNWSLHSYVRLQWLMSRLNKGVPGMCKKEN